MAIIAGKDAKINMEMKTAQALRNAALSVVQTRDDYDCNESVADTLEVLYRLLFAAEQKEADEQ